MKSYLSKAIIKDYLLDNLKKIDNNGDVTDRGNYQSMFILTILEKIKETRLTFSERSVTVL